MKQSLLPFWIHRFIMLMLFCSFACAPEQKVPLQGKPAFDFALRTIDGEEIQLSAYRGKKMVHIIFWATWCPSCVVEIPKLKKLYQEASGKPYEILAIDVGHNDSLTKVRQFRDQYRLPYKIIFDESGQLAAKYDVIGVPTHVVVNREGIIVGTFNQLPDNIAGYLAQMLPAADGAS